MLKANKRIRSFVERHIMIGIAKPVAYVAVNETMTSVWGVSLCIEGESGHRPLSDYSGYTEERAKGIAERLNKRLGINEEEARRIVVSTMASAPPGKSSTTTLSS